jgi:hypothetical protein
MGIVAIALIAVATYLTSCALRADHHAVRDFFLLIAEKKARPLMP